MKYILATVALCLLLAATGPALDGLNESVAEQAKAQQAQVAREKRKNKAAQTICGNGSLVWHDDVSMDCVVRKTGGFK